jgi:hypothetical protein
MQVANEDKRAWDDGEGEVGLGDEVRDVLREGEGERVLVGGRGA